MCAINVAACPHVADFLSDGCSSPSQLATRKQSEESTRALLISSTQAHAHLKQSVFLFAGVIFDAFLKLHAFEDPYDRLEFAEFILGLSGRSDLLLSLANVNAKGFAHALFVCFQDYWDVAVERFHPIRRLL